MNLVAMQTLSPLDLCERGEYEAAAELAGLRVGEWPENDSGGILTQAERLLVAGVITSVIGGIQQTGDQSIAREMLTESIRLFGDDARTLVARSWLARAEYWDGNLDLALELADEVLAVPLDSVTKFRALLTKASVYSDREMPEQAMAALGEMPYESLSLLFKGQFHNQRGRVLRLMKETDRAIVEYDFAIHFFQEAGNVRCQAIAANNLAGIYLETERFDKAHGYAKQARELFEQLGDRTYQAQALDQSALIFLAEGKLIEAESAIISGLAVVEHGQVLTDLQTTYEKIKLNSGNSLLYNADLDATIPCLPKKLPNDLPSERCTRMTPLENAVALIQDNPDRYGNLLDLLIWATNPEDAQHAAELDEIEEMLYSKTEDSIKHRADYRGSRRLRVVPTSVDS